LISIYPNPTNQLLTIKFKNGYKLPELLQLCDVTGNTLMEIKTISTNLSIDISALANGIYFCKFLNGKEIVKTEKIALIK